MRLCQRKEDIHVKRYKNVIRTKIQQKVVKERKNSDMDDKLCHVNKHQVNQNKPKRNQVTHGSTANSRGNA